ncbi:MAG: hypothetical protein WCK77_24280 [Verrucomicrobiota bacterium]
MSAKKPPATLDSLRRQLAEAEATVGSIRAKLAKMEAAESGNPAPVCGLDMLWDAALPMSRQRSSKQLCRKAWAAIPAACRPTVITAVSALKLWNRCDQWHANDHIYAPGLHKYISARMWESLPEKSKSAPLHRNMSNPQPLPQRSQPGITDPEEIARLLGIQAKPKPLPKILSHMHGPEQIEAMLKLINAANSQAVPAP